MDLTMFLLKLYGLLMLFVGAGMLIEHKFYEKVMKDMAKSPAQLVSDGAMAFVVGLVIVMYHNAWTGAWWVTLVTVLGWLTLLKGALRLLFPAMIAEWATAFSKDKHHTVMLGYIALGLGLVLSIQGFFQVF